MESKKVLTKLKQTPSNCFQTIQGDYHYEVKCRQPNGDLAYGLVDLNRCLGNDGGDLTSGANFLSECIGCVGTVVNGLNPSASLSCRECSYEIKLRIGSGIRTFSRTKSSSIDLKKIITVTNPLASIKCKNNVNGSFAYIAGSNPDSSIFLQKTCFIWLTNLNPKGSLFHFSCPDNKGGWVASFIDLNKCMGFYSSILTFGRNYSSDCRDCELYDDDKKIFICYCKGNKTLFSMDSLVYRDKVTNMVNCNSGAKSQLIEEKFKYAGKLNDYLNFLPTPIVTNCNSSLDGTILTSNCQINNSKFTTSLDINKCVGVTRQIKNDGVNNRLWFEFKGVPNGNFIKYPCKNCKIDINLKLTCECSTNPSFPESIMSFIQFSVYLSDIIYVNSNNKLTCFEEEGSTKPYDKDFTPPKLPSLNPESKLTSTNPETKKDPPTIKKNLEWAGEYTTDPKNACDPERCRCIVGSSPITIDGSSLVIKGVSKYGQEEWRYPGDLTSNKFEYLMNWYGTQLKYIFTLTDKQIIMENISYPYCSVTWNRK